MGELKEKNETIAEKAINRHDFPFASGRRFLQ
jgi:hypothetical protein